MDKGRAHAKPYVRLIAYVDCQYIYVTLFWTEDRRPETELAKDEEIREVDLGTQCGQEVLRSIEYLGPFMGRHVYCLTSDRAQGQWPGHVEAMRESIQAGGR